MGSLRVVVCPIVLAAILTVLSACGGRESNSDATPTATATATATPDYPSIPKDDACDALNAQIDAGKLEFVESALGRLDIAPADGADCFAMAAARLERAKALKADYDAEQAEPTPDQRVLDAILKAWDGAAKYWPVLFVIPIAWGVLRLVGNSLLPGSLLRVIWWLRGKLPRRRGRVADGLVHLGPWLVRPLAVGVSSVIGVWLLSSVLDNGIENRATVLAAVATLAALVIGGTILQGIFPRIQLGDDSAALPGFRRLVEAEMNLIGKDEAIGLDTIMYPNEDIGVAALSDLISNPVGKAFGSLLKLLIPDRAYRITTAVSGDDAKHRVLTVSIQQGNRLVDARVFRFTRLRCDQLAPESAVSILAAPAAGFIVHKTMADWFQWKSTTMFGSDAVDSQIYHLAGTRWLFAGDDWRAQQCFATAVERDGSNRAAWLNLATIALETGEPDAAWNMLGFARAPHGGDAHSTEDWNEESGRLFSRVAYNQAVYVVNRDKRSPDHPTPNAIRGDAVEWLRLAIRWLERRDDAVAVQLHARMAAIEPMLHLRGNPGPSEWIPIAPELPDIDPRGQTPSWLYDRASAMIHDGGNDSVIRQLLEIAILLESRLKVVESDPVIKRWAAGTGDEQTRWGQALRAAEAARVSAHPVSPEPISHSQHDVTLTLGV